MRVILPAEASSTNTASFRLRNDAEERLVPAQLTRAEDGELAAELTTVLGPDGLGLTEGTWRITLRVDSRTDDLLVRRAEVVQGGDASDKVTPRSPETGVLYRPGYAFSARAHIVVSAPVARAEVLRVVTRLADVEVIGRFVGPISPRDAVCALVRRSEHARVEVPLDFDGDMFRFHVPLDEVEPAAGTRAWWEVWVETDGERFRVGKHLTDLSDIAAAMRPVERPMITPGGAAYLFLSYYTDHKDLVLRCTSTAVPAGVSE